MIPGSGFFRDASVFASLHRALGDLIAADPDRAALRVWVPGCATGEDAYSIAALLADSLGERPADLGPLVLATDSGAHSIRVGRAGVYAAASLEGMDADLRARHFSAGRERVRVVKSLRALCMFAEHDLLRHPPFAHMDLVSCRNLPIYVDTELQEALLARFHAALNPGGLLLLGKSGFGETVSRLFDPVDAPSRLYRRKEVRTPPLVARGAGDRSTRGVPPGTVPAEDLAPAPGAVAMRDLLLHSYAPPSVLVDSRLQPLHFYGNVERYLAIPRDRADCSAVRLCPPALRGELRTLAHLVLRFGRTEVRGRPTPLEIGGERVAVRLVARRGADAPPGGEGTLVLSFEEQSMPPLPPGDGAGAADQATADGPLQELLGQIARADALGQSRDESALGRRDGSTVPVQADLASVCGPDGNPIYRLATVQDIAEGKRAFAALRHSESALLEAQRLAGLGHWRWDTESGDLTWSDELYRIFGRDPRSPPANVPEVSRYFVPESWERLWAAVQTGLSRGIPYECDAELVRPDGTRRWVTARGEPLRTPEGRVCGLRGTVQDITLRRQAQDSLRESEATYRSLFDNMLNGCAYCRMIFEGGRPVDGVYLNVNAAFATLTGLRDVVGRRIGETIPGVRESDPELLEIWGRVAMTGEPERFEILVRALQMWFVMSVYSPAPGHVVAVFDVVTERKRAELALAQSEARYRALVETSFDWMWEVDSAGRFTFVSPQIRDTLGYAPQEVIGRSPYALMPPAEARRVAAILDPIGAARRPFHGVENRNLHKDGREVIVESSGVPIFAPDGTWMGYRGFDRDVTASRRATAELAAERQRLRTLIDAVPDLIWLKDPQGVFLFCNRPFELLFGAPEAQIVGRTDYDFVPRELADRFRDGDRQAMETGAPYSRQEWLVFAADGHRALHETIKTPVYDRAGEVLGVLGVARDISALNAAREVLEQSQHRLEELVAARTADLRASEDKLRLILESSADGLIGIDAEGRATFANPAAESLLGYRPGELLGRDLHTAIHHTRVDGSPEPRAECPMLAVLRDGRTVRVEGDVFWRADATSFPADFATRPMLRDAAIVGAVVAFSDATLRRQTEQAREHARTEAERLARVKTEFLANMSHEIRTPLNGVLGLAQIGYRTSAGAPKVRDAFARILESGKVLLGIVNDVLDFSKIEAGKLHIERAPIDPGRIVLSVAQTMRARAHERRNRLETLRSADLPAACEGDSVRLSQVLLNLLGNAIKFTEDGTVTLSAGRDGDRLVFRVADTGIGMTDEQIGRLFAPFEQADTGTTRRFGGTGLGLAIARRLVELMGGEIGVTSAPGLGAIFEVRLPCREVLGEPLASANAWASPAAGPRLAGLRLLVAEDNDLNRSVLEDMLTAEGAQVVLAANGRLALDAVRADRQGWDAVLMDLQMPEMDGLEATRRILELVPDLPVIGQTAHALADEREKCRAAGMVDQVFKPIEHEHLVAAVLRYARGADTVPRKASAVAAPAQSRRPAWALPPVDPAAGPPGDAPQGVLDWEGLNRRFRGKQGFVDRLAVAAVAGNREIPSRLRQWAAEGNLGEIAAAAHTLKGVAGNLMAHESAGLASLTQQAARADSPDAAALALALADAVERLVAQLAQRIRERDAGPAG